MKPLCLGLLLLASPAFGAVDARAYDAFYRALIKDVSIFNVTSLLSMEEIKATTALPFRPPQGD